MTEPNVDEIREALKTWCTCRVVHHATATEAANIRTVMDAAPQLLARLALLEQVRRDAADYITATNNPAAPLTEKLAALRKSLDAAEAR